MIIAIDFDGVIVTDIYPDIGVALPDMQDVMHFLYRQGHTLIINTCRTGVPARAAIDMLQARGIPFHYFNRNDPKQTEKYGGESRKISADLYLDDKNLGGFPGWLAVYRAVHHGR